MRLSRERRCGRVIAVHEIVLKGRGHRLWVWAAVDAETGEAIRPETSRHRSAFQALPFTRALNRLIRRLPSVDYSWVRRRIIRLDLKPYESLRKSDGPVVIAVDSSGVSVHKCGGWVGRVYGKKKRYVKVHFAIDVKTKEIVAMDVTMDDRHDSEALPSLMVDASRHRAIIEACMDGAYDSIRSYRLLKRMGVKPIIN